MPPNEEVVSLADAYCISEGAQSIENAQYFSNWPLVEPSLEDCTFQISPVGLRYSTYESKSIEPANIASFENEANIDPILRQSPIDSTGGGPDGRQSRGAELSSNPESSQQGNWRLPPQGDDFWRTFPFEDYMASVQYMYKGVAVPEIEQPFTFADSELFNDPFHDSTQFQLQEYPQAIDNVSVYDYTSATSALLQTAHQPFDSQLEQFPPALGHNSFGTHAQYDNAYSQQPQPSGTMGLYPGLENSNFNSKPSPNLSTAHLNQYQNTLTRDNSMLQAGSFTSVPPSRNRTRNGSEASFDQWPALEQKKSKVEKPKGRRRTNIRPDAKNSRNKKITEFESEDFYDRLENPPASWGPLDAFDQHMFQYNKVGELLNNSMSASDLTFYLLNKFRGAYECGPASKYERAGKPLILVQCVPADSGERYFNGKSDKCRFDCCPVAKGTIKMGQFRVAFDERADDSIDPFHVAGFAHLWCMERFLDFGEIVRNCNIQPDTRALREGVNRMAITGRGCSNNVDLIQDFVEKIRKGTPATGHEGTEWQYGKTLCSILTENYLDNEAQTRTHTRERRRKLAPSNDIGTHRNDLELFVQGEERKAKAAAQKRQMLQDFESRSGTATPSVAGLSYSEARPLFNLEAGFAQNAKKRSRDDDVDESAAASSTERPVKRLKINTTVTESNVPPPQYTARTTRSQTRASIVGTIDKKGGKSTSPISISSAKSAKSPKKSRKGSDDSLFGSLKSAVLDDAYEPPRTRSRGNSTRSNKTNPSRRSSRRA